MHPSRVWQNYVMTAAGSAIVVALGLISNAITDGQCATETENTAGRHCDYLHAHPAWFLAPAALVAIAFALILLRPSTRATQYAVVALSFGVYASVLIGPSVWISTAGHGGG
jgi:hypothetical protein